MALLHVKVLSAQSIVFKLVFCHVFDDCFPAKDLGQRWKQRLETFDE